MLLRFPSAAELHAAIERDMAPPSACRHPAFAAIDEQGQIWIKTSAQLGRSAKYALRRLGVAVNPRTKFEPTEPIGDWLELLPLIPVEEAIPSNVIFEFASASAMVQTIAEMQRIGHERQAFCFAPDSDGAFLQVAAPPLFSLLRAVRHAPDSPRAYVEQAPGVWVELDFRHPFAHLIEPEAGKLLLLSPPRSWRRIAVEPFQSTRLHRPLPLAAAHPRIDRPDRPTIPIRLRLSRVRHGQPPEFWLLRSDIESLLNRFVCEADERIIVGIDFAVAESAGERIVLLKGNRGQSGSPLVIAGAEPFAPVQRFHHLFAPVGLALHPPLRRDLIRDLFAPDSHRVAWLESAHGAVRAQSIATAAFQPLAEAVEYQVEQQRRALPPVDWQPPFKFESFQERLEPVTPPANRRERRKLMLAYEPATPRPIKVVKGRVPQAPKPAEPAKPAEPIVDLPPMPDAQLRERLAELQRQLIEMPGALDLSARRALWPGLSELHARLHLAADAALCWLNVIWTGDPPPELIHRWLQFEQQVAGHAPSANRLDRLLAEPAPLPEQVRFVAVHLIASLYLAPSPLLKPRAGALAHFLETFDSWLPVRAAWLAWLGLSRLTGDALALTRARDRILNHLLQTGLSRDRDLPSFMRGRDAGAALAAEHEQLRSLHRKARGWIGGDSMIIDLIFAYGFARLGHAVGAEELLEGAERRARKAGHAAYWLARAYQHRIRAAVNQEPPAGLPETLLIELGNLPREEARKINLRRRASRILEPFEKIDPFRDYREFRDDKRARELAELASIADAAEIGRRLGRWRKARMVPRDRLRTLAASLAYAPRAGDGFAHEVLADLEAAFSDMPREPDQFRVVELLESGLLLAAHVGRDDVIPKLVGQLHATLAPFHGERLAWLVAQLTSPLFRTLGKLGLNQEVERLVADLTEGILEGMPLASLRKARAVNWGIVLRALAHIAGGWFYLVNDQFGVKILDEVRWKLFERSLRNQEHADLASSYALALGQSPPETAWPRIHELFDLLGQLDVPGANVALCQCEMRVIESAVLAVVAKDFAVGARVRRWLDEDEYLIRHRIHADMVKCSLT